MGSAGRDKAAAPGVGAHAADPAQGAGHSALSCHARAGGPPLGDLWRAGEGVDGEACRAALWVVSTELDASLLRGLLAGGLRTAATQHAGHVELPRLRVTARG